MKTSIRALVAAALFAKSALATRARMRTSIRALVAAARFTKAALATMARHAKHAFTLEYGSIQLH